MIWYGIISEVDGSKARVAVGDLTTGFLPVFQLASSFKQSWVPVKVKEQCIILSPSGDINSGCILRGLYQTDHPAPSIDEEVEITVYSDGTEVSYNAKDSEFKINAGSGKVAIICGNADIKADSATITASAVDLGASGGKGVLTEECICMYTGAKHTGSTVVKAIY